VRLDIERSMTDRGVSILLHGHRREIGVDPLIQEARDRQRRRRNRMLMIALVVVAAAATYGGFHFGSGNGPGTPPSGTAGARPNALPPRVEPVLQAGGYPARTQCGQTFVPPLIRHSGNRIVTSRLVPTCWVVVEQDGYSVHVTPYATAALARLAYVRSRNPSARTTRQVTIDNLLLTAYRLPADRWLRISTLVRSAVATKHR